MSPDPRVIRVNGCVMPQSQSQVESDENLMNRCREGSEEAFVQLEARYRRLVWSMCRRILLYSTADADEAMHEAFVKLWLRRATYTPDRRFRSWLKAIAFATCMDHLRNVGRLKEVPIGISQSEDSPSLLRSLVAGGVQPDYVARMDELKNAFSRCWELLPGHQRALLQFIDWSDWKGSWMFLASATGRTPAAVRIATIRYVRGLVDCLKQNGFKPNSSELLEVLEQSVSRKEDAYD